MATWCLTKEYADKFKKALRDGTISPAKMIEMSSEERRKFLAKYVGEFNAKFANREFESKLLLKNQQRGLITWASKAAGIKETTKKDITDKVLKLERALSPEDEGSFLADIAEQRLGVQVSHDEGRKIHGLAKQLRELYDPAKPMWEQGDEYWTVKQALVSYMRDITPTNIATTKLGVARKGLSDVLSIQRAVKTGFDLSAPLRQGRTYMGRKEWNKAFANMFRYARSQSAVDGLEVNMMRHPYAEQAIKVKRELGLTLLGETFTQREEQFASKLIDKIPFLKGSERAFVGFLNDLRFNRFVNTIGKLESTGVRITENPETMKDLAKVIGAATGRGTLGSAEGAARSLATVMFSPRWLASRFETLFNPLTKSGPARVEAIKALGSLMGTSVAVLGMLKMAGADVETDPRSSDFGKAKFGNTRFDMTGGLSPIITLLSRLGTLSTKSSTTGAVRSLISGDYGAQSGLDVITSFLTNKTAPAASIVRDILKGEDFEGEPVRLNDPDFIKYLSEQLFVPLFASDTLEAFNDASGGALIGSMTIPASLFGIGVSTYSPKKKTTDTGILPSLPKLPKLPSLKL